MPEMPINLNLAFILQRLLTQPDGWKVSELLDELQISARTYRKYRKLLQEHFSPSFDQNHGVRIQEVRRGEDTFLTLSSPLYIVPEKQQNLVTTILHNYLSGQDPNEVILAFEEQRLFWIEAPIEPDWLSSTLLQRTILGLLTQRTLRVRFDGGHRLTLMPLTLIVRASTTMEIVAFDDTNGYVLYPLSSFEEVETIGSLFEYPDEQEYAPTRFLEAHSTS